MKIFLDIGSHHGETLDEVIKPEYGFDVIYAFEPSSECCLILQKYKEMHNNLIINNFGLSNISNMVKLYDAGTGGASVYQDKIDFDDVNVVEKIQLVNASEWIINNTNVNDIIYMKLNCEGSECDIIENLLINNIFDNITHIMIDFDVRKIPSQYHREYQILSMIQHKKNWKRCEEVMIGSTHQNKIKNWIYSCKM